MSQVGTPTRSAAPGTGEARAGFGMTGRFAAAIVGQTSSMTPVEMLSRVQLKLDGLTGANATNCRARATGARS